MYALCKQPYKVKLLHTIEKKVLHQFMTERCKIHFSVEAGDNQAAAAGCISTQLCFNSFQLSQLGPPFLMIAFRTRSNGKHAIRTDFFFHF